MCGGGVLRVVSPIDGQAGKQPDLGCICLSPKMDLSPCRVPFLPTHVHILHTAVVDAQDQDITCTNRFQLVHDLGHIAA